MLVDAELEEFIVAIVNANNRGVSAARNVSSEPNWSFGQSLFFAGTILTTIGRSSFFVLALSVHRVKATSLGMFLDPI